jgi:hypothetical protein
MEEMVVMEQLRAAAAAVAAALKMPMEEPEVLVVTHRSKSGCSASNLYSTQ